MLSSQEKAATAQSAGRFDRSLITLVDPITGAMVLSSDNHLRPDSTLETLAALEPAFVKAGASRLSDDGFSLWINAPSNTSPS